MGRYLNPGHTYEDGQTITGPSLTEHVSDAVLKATAISEQILKDPAAFTDELLINDGNLLKKITLQVLRELILGQMASEDLSDEVRTPVGVIMDYAGTIEPEGWLFCFGQTISRTSPYDRLFESIGIAFGVGDGINTFSLPDCRGRVTAGKDNMGGVSANRLTTLNANNLGATGGDQLLQSHSHTFPNGYFVGNAGSGSVLGTGSALAVNISANTVTSGGGIGQNVQPTIVFNKIIRYL